MSVKVNYHHKIYCSITPIIRLVYGNSCLVLQVSDPVAAEFSLNTQMFLLSKREMWLSDGSMGFGEGTDAAFSDGTTTL